MEVSKNEDPFLGSPYNKDYSMYKSILGPLFMETLPISSAVPKWQKAEVLPDPGVQPHGSGRYRELG